MKCIVDWLLRIVYEESLVSDIGRACLMEVGWTMTTESNAVSNGHHQGTDVCVDPSRTVVTPTSPHLNKNRGTLNIRMFVVIKSLLIMRNV